MLDGHLSQSLMPMDHPCLVSTRLHPNLKRLPHLVRMVAHHHLLRSTPVTSPMHRLDPLSHPSTRLQPHHRPPPTSTRRPRTLRPLRLKHLLMSPLHNPKHHLTTLQHKLILTPRPPPHPTLRASNMVLAGRRCHPQPQCHHFSRPPCLFPNQELRLLNVCLPQLTILLCSRLKRALPDRHQPWHSVLRALVWPPHHNLILLHLLPVHHGGQRRLAQTCHRHLYHLKTSK